MTSETWRVGHYRITELLPSGYAGRSSNTLSGGRDLLPPCGNLRADLSLQQGRGIITLTILSILVNIAL